MILHWINAQIFRGPEPKGQDDWNKLRASVKNVLDLETNGNDFFHEDIFNAQIVASNNGIRTWNLPLGQIFPPSKKIRERAAHLMDNLKGPGIYVHCKAGVDRTGMICATYRMRYQGWSKKDAVKEMKELGMHWWYKFWWPYFL